MTISSTSPRTQYTATSGQTVFPYPFKIWADSDLVVYLTPNGSDPDDTSDLQTLTTHYTVSGAGDAGGGNVTLVTGATAGDIITIKRDITQERTADYQTGGDLLATTLNGEQDKLLAMVQELAGKTDRAFRLKDTATATGITAPEPEANRFLKWNAAADGIENTAGTTPSDSTEMGHSSGGAPETASDYLDRHEGFSGWAALLAHIDAKGIQNGKTYRLRYHTTEGDGGGGVFRGVTGAAASTYSTDGGITLIPTGGDGSSALVRDYSGPVLGDWFGLGAGADDSATVNTLVTNHADVELQAGKTYIFTSTTPMIPAAANRRFYCYGTIQLNGAAGTGALQIGDPTSATATTNGDFFIREIDGQSKAAGRHGYLLRNHNTCKIGFGYANHVTDVFNFKLTNDNGGFSDSDYYWQFARNMDDGIKFDKPSDQATITGATQANPVVITATGHGYSNGDLIHIYDVGGMTEINDLNFTVANVTADTFELSGINGTGYTAYTSGGKGTIALKLTEGHRFNGGTINTSTRSVHMHKASRSGASEFRGNYDNPYVNEMLSAPLGNLILSNYMVQSGSTFHDRDFVISMASPGFIQIPDGDSSGASTFAIGGNKGIQFERQVGIEDICLVRSVQSGNDPLWILKPKGNPGGSGAIHARQRVLDANDSGIEIKAIDSASGNHIIGVVKGSGTSTNLLIQNENLTALQVYSDGTVGHRQYAKASLPSASPAGRMVMVTDEVGGYTPAFSDGTNWRRVSDLAVVS